MKKDLKWWKDFCSVFNCRNLILNTNTDLPLYSDSSLQGYGAWYGKDYLYGMWSGVDTFDPGCGHYTPPPKFDNLRVHEGNINVYELYPVLVGLKRWVSRYKNTRLQAITDNMQVMAMLNTGRSKNKLCMAWLREIFWVCFINNIEIHSTYIRSEDNILADHLSRLNYRGVPKKCITTLRENDMCCFSYRPRMEVSETKEENIHS